MVRLVLGLLLATPAWAGDKDKDGVPNNVDACKDQPEDTDGFEDQDGCPDPDNDEDGISDADDGCADEAEDIDGFADADGCPDPDNDEDGVADADDQCDGEVEPADDPIRDGCPEVTTQLLTEDGWLAAVGELTGTLVASAGQQAEGCEQAAATAQAWVGKHDPTTLRAQFEKRLARGVEPFDPEAARGLLNQKAQLYPQVKPALDIFCRDHPGWNAVVSQVDAVFAEWMTPPDEEG